KNKINQRISGHYIRRPRTRWDRSHSFKSERPSFVKTKAVAIFDLTSERLVYSHMPAVALTRDREGKLHAWIAHHLDQIALLRTVDRPTSGSPVTLLPACDGARGADTSARRPRSLRAGSPCAWCYRS